MSSEVIVSTLPTLTHALFSEEKGLIMGNSYATLSTDNMVTARNMEAAQKSAVDYLKTLAERLGANAILGLRIERVNLGPFVDVLAYGTAAKVTFQQGVYR